MLAKILGRITNLCITNYDTDHTINNCNKSIIIQKNNIYCLFYKRLKSS